MREIHEIAPGILFDGEKLMMCPGCGLEALGFADTDPADVLAWFLGAGAALSGLGCRGLKTEDLEKAARQYVADPWHGKKNSSGPAWFVLRGEQN